MIDIDKKNAEVFQNLLDTYGLDTILEQNDIDEVDLLMLLYTVGWFDYEDYFFDDIEDVDD